MAKDSVNCINNSVINMEKVMVDLSLDLRKKYGIRSFQITRGDVVRIKTGSKKGEGGKVISVNHMKNLVTVDGITLTKADNKQKEFPLKPHRLVITRLDLSRNERIEKIRKLAALKKITINEDDLRQEPEEPATPEIPAPEPQEALTDESVAEPELQGPIEGEQPPVAEKEESTKEDEEVEPDGDKQD